MIPTPWAIRWREIKVTVFPIVVFALALGGAVYYWNRAGVYFQFEGVAEKRVSVLTSPVSGVVTEVRVEPHDRVPAGETLVVLDPRDQGVNADLIRMRLDLASFRRSPTIQQRSYIDLQRLQMTVLERQADLAVAEIEAETFRRQYARSEELFQAALVSEELHDLARQEVLAAEMRIEKLRELVARMEQEITAAQTEANGGDTNGPDPLAPMIDTALEGDLDEFAGTLEPFALVADTECVVENVFVSPGQHVEPGDLIVETASPEAKRIVMYLRQPYPFDPQVGQPVRVEPRSRNQEAFDAFVLSVGATVQTITNHLARVTAGRLVDAGLPIVIHVPPGQALRPGELVDIKF